MLSTSRVKRSKMLLIDVKRSLSKNLNITIPHESKVKDEDTFDQKWKSFIDIPRKDNVTHNSWYFLQLYTVFSLFLKIYNAYHVSWIHTTSMDNCTTFIVLFNGIA